MPNFIAGSFIKDSVQRLARCDAKASLVDLLIFKRALVLAAADAKAKGAAVPKSVTTGVTSPTYTSAIDQVARCEPGSPTWSANLPYYSPFGADRDKGKGFKSKKYPSNGPSDTASRWQNRGDGAPLESVPGTSPKQFRFVAQSATKLSAFFLMADAVEDPQLRPTLADTAVWWFRTTDLEARFGKKNPSIDDLIDGCAKDFDLNKEEISGLFASAKLPSQMLPLAFSSSCSPSEEYLQLPAESQEPAKAAGGAGGAQDDEERVAAVVDYIVGTGFVFQPWQVAAFIAAARTKPFIILAGISGTGKTKLPRLVAEATGAEFINIPVRPDWTDSSELLGYERLDGTFVPGRLLRVAKNAADNPTKQFFVMLDEMNIARVEYYLAEVLSHIEERFRVDGRIVSRSMSPSRSDPNWKDVGLPSNLCIVGSVNMDESTQSFSKKVLDRSFVIEFSDIDLSAVGSVTAGQKLATWTAKDWEQSYLTLAEFPDSAAPFVAEVITALVAINDCLEPAQLQVGYRVRDEIVLFCANARACIAAFTTLEQAGVDPLDLAISMKILPRIQGSGAVVGGALERLNKWASPAASGEQTKSTFPYSAERLGIMLKRLKSAGFTSYWL